MSAAAGVAELPVDHQEAELRQRVKQLEVENERLELALQEQLRRHGAQPYPPQATAAWIRATYDTAGADGWIRQRLSQWGRALSTPDRGTVEKVVAALGGDPFSVPEPADLVPEVAS